MASAMKDENPIQLLEEAAHLLRRAPAAAISAHLVGSVPFLVGLLFFATDMSHSRGAVSGCVAEALGVAALFIWMVCWKAVLAGRLRRELEGVAEPGWTLRRAFRLFAIQGCAQGAKLFVLPAALLALVPAASATALFRNITALADNDPLSPGEIIARSRRQSSFARRQNWFALGLLLLFTLVVFVNVAVTLAVLPSLLRMLTGYETVFSRSGPSYVLNSTFFAVAAGITWLCVDPLLQAFYVLRCFVGQSITTGADLRAGLRKLPVMAALVVIVIGLAAAPKCEAAPTAPAQQISADALDRSIDEVLTRGEYRWRLPRSNTGHPANAFVAFTDRVITMLGDATRAVGRAIDRFLRWLGKALGSEPDAGDRGAGSGGGLRVAVWVLAFAAACLSVLVFLRFRRRARLKVRAASAAGAALDLSDEALVATQLPEDGWLAMAQDSLTRGEYRLALRALFLASLAHLAHHQLVTIHRAKSNGEYETELRRRSRGSPEIAPCFRENRHSFERGWYGQHDVTTEQLDGFRANLDRIRGLTAVSGSVS